MRKGLFSSAMLTVLAMGFTAAVLTAQSSEQGSDRDVPLQIQAGGHVLGFGPDSVVIASGTHALKWDFIGARESRPVSDQAEPFSVVYSKLWPGISVTYDGISGGISKSTYTVSPGTDPGAILLRTNVPVATTGDGRLRYAFAAGEMVESKPVAWQEINGRKVDVEAFYQIRGEREYGFRVADYNPEFPLVIDPVLTWSTYIGRAESTVDSARAVAFYGTFIYVCGTSDGPWGSPMRGYAGGTSDAFVAKFNTSGARQWITFLGGTALDEGWGVAVDISDNVYVSGSSEATWGTTVRGPFSGGRDAFVAKLNSSGNLQWNTFLGGSGTDEGRGIAVDSSGSYAYVTGGSATSWGSPLRDYSGNGDAFAAKLNSSGTLQWSTFLGGGTADTGNDIAFSLFNSGSVFVAGDSHGNWGSNIGRAYTALQDGFVAYLTTNGALQWNTFVGGPGTDSAQGVTATSTGAALVAGTSSASWGTSPARSFSTGPDAFAAMLHPAGALNWNTFLGGTGNDSGLDICLEGDLNIYLAGTSAVSWGASPVQPFRGVEDAFAVKLSAANGSLQWNSFLGSDQVEEAAGIVHIGSGRCAVVGTSGAGPWPAGIPVSAYAGDNDGFLEIMSASGGFSAYAFMGGLGRDEGKAIDVDAAGNVYVAGTSRKTWGTPIRAFTGTSLDSFVAKFNAGGVLQWHTFIGGNSSDQVSGIAVTATGVVYVTGQSTGIWGSPIRAYGGGPQDAFAAKLNASGGLVWNTFLGGSFSDYGNGIAVDGSDFVYIAGYSYSSWEEIPVRGYTGSNDAFAAKLNAEGVRQWHTFLGGTGSEIGYGIAADSLGNVYLAGTATAAWGSSPRRGFTGSGSPDGFAVKLNSSGALQWHTFLGGSNSDSANSIAVFGTDTVYVVGQSRSGWGSPIASFPGDWSGFAAELRGNGDLQWNTFFGAASVFVEPLGADVDILGNLYIGGPSSSTWGSPFRAHSGNDDVFAAMFNTEGGLVWNGFFGSAGAETFGGLAVGSGGDVYCGGTAAQSWGSPVGAYGGGGDAFALRITNELPPSITVISPNGGETWGQETVQEISWLPTGALSNVKIDYSINGGSSWTQIAASAPNTGTYFWTLPQIVSSSCKVRISAAGGGLPSDQSDATFTITDQIPTISLSRTSFYFGAEQNGSPTPGQTTLLSNSGQGTLTWAATPVVDWISVSPASGTGNAVLTISINRTNLDPGAYSGAVRIAAGGASNTPQSITVNLNVVGDGADAVPFGFFDEPADGSTVRSSIAVTGWVLDDVHVASVKIYRGTDASDRIFIGDATFVEGARPDVITVFPTYPENERAGWGYMMLTNFLPGDGIYGILAYATDSKGHEVLLGTKTITVDNAHAVLPFGAIDTPAQGGTASGSHYYNFGWALTPQPKSIPIDGSTIWVWIDGVPLGHPTYNNFRGDIAALFPGLANSNGAVGVYALNTELLTNGVHNIAWSVEDSNGDIDGIGSRFFTVANLAGGALAGVMEQGISLENLETIPENSRIPVYIKRGFRESDPVETAFPDPDGSIRIEAPMLSRTAVYYDLEQSFESRERLSNRGTRILFQPGPGEADKKNSAGIFEAYQVTAGGVKPLPIGSSFDRENGILYWQPGPGFAGEFVIAIVKRDGARATRTTLRLTVLVSPANLDLRDIG